MASIVYVCHVLRGASLKKLSNVIDRAHEKSGKSKTALFFDIVDCAVKYGAGYYDYLIFAFYDMTPTQRATYVTRMKNKKIVRALNNESYAHIFDNKNQFDKRFRKYLHRDFLDLGETTPESFRTFMKDKQVVFGKPNCAECGHGIEKLKTADFSDLDAMFAYVMNPAKNFGVLEEMIVQHEDMAKLYPLAVNTIRIVTVADGDKAYCAYASCKMGNEGKFVDNMENSGLACPIDQKTGCLIGPAHTSKLINFDEHPYTGVKLAGYHIPYVNEAIALCEKAALEVPQMRYIGWDVAICQDGPAIIEGNNYPGYDFFQLPEHTPDKIGLIPFFQRFIPGLK